MQNDIKMNENKMFVYLSLKYRFLMRSNYLNFLFFLFACFSAVPFPFQFAINLIHNIQGKRN